MAVDWLADVRLYDACADEGVVRKIVTYCGIALQSRDGQLVAMADPKECETVRENFLKKKLGLTQSDATLDEAIQSVREVMKADRTKNRVTVYYLLTRHFGSLNLFGGVAGAAAGSAGLAAAATGVFSGDNDKEDTGSVAPLAAAAGIAGAGVAAVSGAAGAVTGAASAPPAAVRSNFDDDDSAAGWGWLKWLLLAALLAALLFFLLKSCSGQEATPLVEPDAATVGASATTETVGTAETAATTETVAPTPVGAGITAGERNGKPMLTVYFDTGKSAVTNDLAAASAKVKAFVASNAGAKLGVSGFNDPTGNAAANAELSKKRAQAVSKALEAAGIPAASIEMVKPAESTDSKVDGNAARRVEVVVQ